MTATRSSTAPTASAAAWAGVTIVVNLRMP